MTFKQWKNDVQMWSRMYAIPADSQLDWVVNSLEEEAKREMAILPEGERNTVEKVFKKLEELYARTAPASVARSLFFNCRQQAAESERVFALRLQECWQKMMIKDTEKHPEPRGADARPVPGRAI